MKHNRMNSPVSLSSVRNPLKNGERVKKLKKQYVETLAKTGLKPLQSPLK